MSKSFRSDFPIFQRYPNLAYLDNAATTQMPHMVIHAMNDFDSYGKANVHRGIYDLSNHATTSYEEVRKSVANFLGASDANSIAFTKGTTESINVIARSFVQPRLNGGDNVVTTLLEHHANFLPWQTICKENKAELRVASITESGDLDLDALDSLLDSRTRMLAVSHISNTLGTINPVKEIVGLAHRKGIPVLIDAAQSCLYYKLDVLDLECDFLVFSAHKMFGPFGVGVLYASDKHVKNITPYNYGGGIIKEVTVDESNYVNYPYNLEAGTPNVTGVIGLGKAVEFIGQLDRDEMQSQIKSLTEYCEERLNEIDQVTIIGNPGKRSSILSFTMDHIHPHDIASFLNKDGIAVRAGMHCTQPLLNHLQISATVRISFSIYNTREEVNHLQSALVELIKFWT